MYLGQETQTAGPGPNAPDVVAWDPTLLTNPGASIGLNRGCPPGYFAQYVGIGEPGSTPLGPSGTTAIRCRLIRTSNAATIQAESGTTTPEMIGIFTGAIRDTARQFRAKIPSPPDIGKWLLWILGGALAISASAYAFGAGGYAAAFRRRR